jgi:hypothetical protein
MKLEIAESTTESAVNALQATSFTQHPITHQAAINDGAWGVLSGLRNAIVRVARWVRSLGPYLAIELILPGGSIIAVALWTYRHRLSQRQRIPAPAIVAAPAARKPVLACVRCGHEQ